MVHPQFDPIAFQVGPLSVHWYGIMYLVGFFVGQYLGIWRASRDLWRNFSPEEVKDLLFYAVVGIILGGRVGYVVFYHFDLFLQDPMYLFRITEGGMSFHGGFLGVMVAVIIFARHKQKSIFAVGDFIAPLVPPGLFFGRFGNFINGELWGRPTEMSWGMVFPQAGDTVLRHPSQLYQMAGEGLMLFILLWWFSTKPRPRIAVTAMFMLLYGILRTAAEFFRQPDAHLSHLLAGFLTRGMLLSIPMIMVGAALLVFAYQFPVYERARETKSEKGGKVNKVKKT